MVKKVLITGGLGYIGSHTAVSLIENGYEVVIIDNLVNSNLEVLDRINQITGVLPLFVHLDLCEQNNLRDLFDSENGNKFRKIILEQGGSQNPMKLVENFLGRKSDNNAFLRKHGIAE